MVGIVERTGLPGIAFDLIEPEWPKVDRTVLAFLKSEALHPADIIVREDRVVRFNPELAWWAYLTSLTAWRYLQTIAE